jgi:DNA (cytosine-5)-methyltransferase 1
MKALSLFTGIMGIDVACEWSDIETVAMCERDPFCQKVIRKHKPNIPLYEDIKELSKARLESDGIDCRTIGLIHAGYPCQGESYTGKRRGAEDDRWLWPETCRLLEEITPDWFIGENVSGHITMGLDTVLDDLGSIGYTAQPFHIPALAVDGDHERYRIFIVAYADKKSGLQENQEISSIRKGWFAWENAGWGSWKPIPRTDWSVSRPPVSRTINGISNRMDRCFALGNAVSPYQIHPITASIKKIYDKMRAF